MPAKVYSDKDADLSVLKNKTLAVLGFGSQGHAHALNLKDSGMNVIIGLYEGSKSIPIAQEKGFEVVSTAAAVRRSDVIFVALPDTKQAAAYQRDMAPNLNAGKTLLFSHGFSIHFKTVVPPKNVDVILVAPKGPGHIVRRQYLEGKGVPSLIAIYQNPGKQAKNVALAWAKGIGATRAGVIETTFKEEYEDGVERDSIRQIRPGLGEGIRVRLQTLPRIAQERGEALHRKSWGAVAILDALDEEALHQRGAVGVLREGSNGGAE